MRKTTLLLLAACLTGCAPKGNPEYRAREERIVPDPTLGTGNPEAAWYKTQVLASPPAASSPAFAPTGAPANKKGVLPATSVAAKPSELKDAQAAKEAAAKK